MTLSNTLSNLIATEFISAFVKNHEKTKESISNEILVLAGNDESEFFIIAKTILRKDALEAPSVDVHLSLAYAFSVASMNSFSRGDLVGALEGLTQASKCLGSAQGRRRGDRLNSMEKRIAARKKANLRHLEDNKIKQDAIDYYATHHAPDIEQIKGQKGKAKDAAAVKMTKQQPIVFRTARGYINEYHRNKKNTSC